MIKTSAHKGLKAFFANGCTAGIQAMHAKRLRLILAMPTSSTTLTITEGVRAMNTMYNPPHPGELLRDLWLEPLGLTITALAERLHVSRKALSEVLNGRASVSPEMALRLERAFGKSAQSWLGHQAAYDLWQIEGRREGLGVRRISESDARS